jgi:hypothetical protein
MNKIKLFDKVQIAVQTGYGIVNVEFTIIYIRNEYSRVYGMVAQDRVVIGQHMVDNTWRLSEPIDLLNIYVTNTSHDDVTGESELNAHEASNC